jgi:DNA-directed RNA polymerase specialized sigma24 family protein
MTTTDGHRARGPHGTDIGALRAVQDAVARLIRRKWSGWSTADQEDLGSLVLEKYVSAFGRDRLPTDLHGDSAVPIAWLTKVVQNTGIDAFRKRQVRPAVAVDFAGQDGADVEARMLTAIEGRRRLSAIVADRVDLQRGLRALGDAYPMDLELIRWRLIEDKPLADVAVRVGKSEEATKKAIQRAVVRLRALLQNERAVDTFQRATRRVVRRS